MLDFRLARSKAQTSHKAGDSTTITTTTTTTATTPTASSSRRLSSPSTISSRRTSCTPATGAVGYNTIPRQLVTVFAHSTSPAVNNTNNRQIPVASFKAISCSKPLPSVPTDVEEDDDPEELESPIESDISTSSASTACSSSMEADWHETVIRKQVAQLDIDFDDHNLVRSEQPSAVGLRRRIIAAALDAEASNSSATTGSRKSTSGKRSASGSSQDSSDAAAQGDSIARAWLGAQSSTGWKVKTLRKKLSFSRKSSEPMPSMNSALHDPMPDLLLSPSTASIYSTTSTGTDGRSSSNTTFGLSLSQNNKMLKRDKQLAEMEREFDLAVLSRFETAELHMVIYTEHRQGSWVIKGPSEPGADPLQEPPLIYSPWDVKIDSRAIIERKKLRSFVELSDTTCDVECSTCNSHLRRQLGNNMPSAAWVTVDCSHCAGRGSVRATYVVCVTLRQSTFLPLKLPIHHVAGKHQGKMRPYLPKTTSALSHVDLLRMRSMEAIRSCALRVGRAHAKEHEARLLMAKAVVERRSCNSVAVLNRTNGILRTFDVTDGGFIQMNSASGFTEEESRISETPELTHLLSSLPITALTQDGVYAFCGLEVLDLQGGGSGGLSKLGQGPVSTSTSAASSPLQTSNAELQSDSASGLHGSSASGGLLASPAMRSSRSTSSLRSSIFKISRADHRGDKSDRHRDTTPVPASPSPSMGTKSIDSGLSFETAHTTHTVRTPQTYTKVGNSGTYF
ncbi:hypothetical protein BCV70DRAFT_213253 [Testicularia cyperi]|uniref:Uncharacterized protein n=1 Tax=Testicularia cyperi TaxID=1882483 RepID=A0A317XHX3_9BASI|nr:hypothetical protein BCV70DRAFT_213253 [Testicularia cyperi]